MKNESGEVFANIYVRFVCQGWTVVLENDPDSEGSYLIRGAYEDSGTSLLPAATSFLPAEVHAIQNKSIRLQRPTGIPFHQLDWLFMNALCSHPLYTVAEDIHDVLFKDGTVVTVLAHFLEWNDKY